MADINQVITLGIGTPGDIEHFVLLGLTHYVVNIIPGKVTPSNALRGNVTGADALRGGVAVGNSGRANVVGSDSDNG